MVVIFGGRRGADEQVIGDGGEVHGEYGHTWKVESGCKMDMVKAKVASLPGQVVMKRYLTVGIMFGILVLIIVAISWFKFPAWQNPTSGGFLTLVGLTLVGVLTFLQGVVSIWKDLKEESRSPASLQ